jgi:hypothetical protein
VGSTSLRQVYALDRALGSILGGALRSKFIDGMFRVADEVSTGKAKRAVTASRRMTDLLYLSAAHGLAPPLEYGIEVVSDRLLGLLPAGAWAQDEAPTIALDDLKISGETMKRLAAACQRLVGDGIVDERPLVILHEEEQEAIRQLHEGFAQTFARHAMPYVTDFVVSREHEVAPEQMVGIFADDQWRVVDVTGDQAATKSNWTCSLFPDGDLRDQFMDELGRARDLVQVVKVRLFSISKGSGSIVRFVPMVLTRGPHVDELTRWLEVRGLAQGREREDDARIAAATLLSMVLSAGLFRVFRDRVASEYGLSISEDQDLINLVAGCTFADQVRPVEITEFEGLLESRVEAKSRELAPSPGNPGALFLWPGNVPDAQKHYVQVGDDEVRDAFAKTFAAAAARPAPPPGKPGPRGVYSLTELAEATQSSVAAASVALDVHNDSGEMVSESTPVGERVERLVGLAEFTGSPDEHKVRMVRKHRREFDDSDIKRLLGDE